MKFLEEKRFFSGNFEDVFCLSYFCLLWFYITLFQESPWGPGYLVTEIIRLKSHSKSSFGIFSELNDFFLNYQLWFFGEVGYHKFLKISCSFFSYPFNTHLLLPKVSNEFYFCYHISPKRQELCILFFLMYEDVWNNLAHLRF